MCVGASGDTARCLELAQETPRLVRSRSAASANPSSSGSSSSKSSSSSSAAAGNNQLERFLHRRAVRMQAECPRDDAR